MESAPHLKVAYFFLPLPYLCVACPDLAILLAFGRVRSLSQFFTLWANTITQSSPYHSRSKVIPAQWTAREQAAVQGLVR